MLLNDISSEIDQLTSHFSREIIHVSNFEILNVSEFVFDALDHALFQRSQKTTEFIEMELVVASLRRVSLCDGRQDFIRRLCSLIETFNDWILDKTVAVDLEQALD